MVDVALLVEVAVLVSPELGACGEHATIAKTMKQTNAVLMDRLPTSFCAWGSGRRSQSIGGYALHKDDRASARRRVSVIGEILPRKVRKRQ